MAAELERAIVVGSGPNGLAAALVMTEAGIPVTVYESKATIGGGCRTAELTVPGCRHDVCSAVHPLAVASPFFKSVDLRLEGLRWIKPPIPLAHPLDSGEAAVILEDIDRTVAELGVDGDAYRQLMSPFVRRWDDLADTFLGPLTIPAYPALAARFGIRAVRSAASLARSTFRTQRAQALFAGCAAHSMLRLDQSPSAAVGVILGVLAHVSGWPIPEGGAQAIADALVAKITSRGSVIETNREVTSMHDLPAATAYLFDITPKQLLRVAEERFSGHYRNQLRRYRYGMGAHKVDWVLDRPIPFTAEACRRAGTVHIGGTLDEIATAERQVHDGGHPDRPFVLLSQPSLFDSTRCPEKLQTAWGYCHVPNGSTTDMTERIEQQIERFAPGFRESIRERHVMTAGDLEAYNANYVGGDINGGVQDWRQLFTRPAMRINPYTTPDPKIFLCSSSTPPGGGVHGMCGFHAAHTVLKKRYGIDNVNQVT